jgi:hypothetical protein
MKEFVIALAIVFVIGFFIFYPIAVIWSMNTLFKFAIPFTLETWAATVVLSSLFAAKITVNKK